ARAYAQQKRLPETEATLQKALSLDPRNFDTYVLLGTLYAQEQSFAKAQAQFSQATTADPSSPGLWTVLGMLDEQLHQPAEAEQAYNRAVTLDPNNGIADNNLASILTSRPGELDRALVLAQRAKRALPTVANVNDTLGWIYVNQSVYQLAIPLLQQAVDGQPNVTDYRVHLATALYRNGQKQEARNQLDAAIRLDKGLAQQPDIQQMLRN
ncbi:MAG: tetratricopeptide repeat protein, partial [Terriglobales bacterium]